MLKQKMTLRRNSASYIMFKLMQTQNDMNKTKRLKEIFGLRNKKKTNQYSSICIYIYICIIPKTLI
jgi:hypothetical protein